MHFSPWRFLWYSGYEWLFRPLFTRIKIRFWRLNSVQKSGLKKVHAPIQRMIDSGVKSCKKSSVLKRNRPGLGISRYIYFFVFYFREKIDDLSPKIIES